MPGKIDVLMDLTFGDNGKGNVTDFIADNYDYIARTQGGTNAGHTIYHKGEKHILHQLPSGVFRPNTKLILGQGMVIDPKALYEEVRDLEAKGFSIKERLYISSKAHLITDYHKEQDAQRENTNSKIGTTKKGIGPAYRDKVDRSGIRVGEYTSQSEYLFYFKDNIVDTLDLVHSVLSQGKNILAEVAQGFLLDICFGTYPMVTSSNCGVASVFTGLGVPAKYINDVYGVTKAYSTRVGEGSLIGFEEEVDVWLREKGNEFGATTGRPRRSGWLDAHALEYAIKVNGVNRLVMTKLDILSGLEKIKVVDKYKRHGKEVNISELLNYEGVEPEYVEFDGWVEDISEARSVEDLPDNAKKFVEWLEERLNLQMDMIGVGPHRYQKIV